MNATAILLTLAAPVALFVALFVALVVGVVGAYARRAFLVPSAAAASAGLILREAWAQLVILAWTLVRRGHRTGAGEGLPVVFVHGLAADGTSMWGYRRAVATLGRPTSAPSLGGMFLPIEKHALRLVGALERALCAHPDGVDVVCHSMGGVVLRAALGMRPDLGERIRHVVTVASPHTGTAAARHIPLPEARQLFIGAPFISGLPTLRQLLPHARLTTISSAHDAVVYPQETCRVEGAAEHALSGFGHAELLVHPRVVDLVVASLTTPS